MSYGGHEAKFYYVAEAVYGEIPATPAMTGIESVQNIEPFIDPGNLKLRGTGTRDLTSIKQGLRKPDVKVVYDVPISGPSDLLLFIMSLASLAVEVVYERPASIRDLRFTGCRIDKGTVECSVEDVLKASIELMGQDFAIEDAKISGATYTDYAGAIPFSESYVSKGDGDGGNQEVNETVTDWKFTIENNLKRVPVIRNTNGNLLKYLQERHRVLTGELTCEFETRDEYYDVINDLEFSLKFGLGGEKYALFKYCKWDSVGTPTKIEDLISVKAPFTARQVTLT